MDRLQRAKRARSLSSLSQTLEHEGWSSNSGEDSDAFDSLSLQIDSIADLSQGSVPIDFMDLNKFFGSEERGPRDLGTSRCENNYQKRHSASNSIWEREAASVFELTMLSSARFGSVVDGLDDIVKDHWACDVDLKRRLVAVGRTIREVDRFEPNVVFFDAEG